MSSHSKTPSLQRVTVSEIEPETMQADFAYWANWWSDTAWPAIRTVPGRLLQGAKDAAYKAAVGFWEFCRFPSIWKNIFPGFLWGSLKASRETLTQPFLSNAPVLSDQTVDAFWIKDQISFGLHQVASWVSPAFQWVQPALKWLSPAVTWLFPVLKGMVGVLRWVSPYLPFVGLLFSTLVATSDFWHSENKNIVTTSKWLAEVSGSVLLGAGLALVAWGGVVAAMYTAPLLIGLAAGIVAAVGLVKSGYHFYQAINHPEQWKEHALKGVKEILKTTISVTACVLTFFGMHMHQDVSRSLLTDAGELYKGAAAATDVVLAAGGTLTLMNLGPKLYAGCKKLVAKCTGSPAEEPVPELTILPLGKEKMTDHMQGVLNDRCAALAATKSQTGIVDRLQSAARQQKLQLLRDARSVWIGEMTYEAFDEVVKRVEKTAYKTGVFCSFWKEQSETKRLVDKTLAWHKPSDALRMRG